MADITHLFPIKAGAQEVFNAVSKPEGLDNWWTESSAGTPGLNHLYNLNFGPSYHWKATVTQYKPGKLFEFKLTYADEDWMGTKVGFRLSEEDGATLVDFYHTGWPETNKHYRISSFCWAMYLRILKRYLEYGEQVPYEERLEA